MVILQLGHLRFYPAACLTGIILFSIIANVYAQGGVYITDVHYPNSVSYGSTGTIHIDVSVMYRTSTPGPLFVTVYDLSKGVGPSGEINGTDVVVTGSPYLAEGYGNPPSSTGSISVGWGSVPLMGKETFHFAFSTSHVPAVAVWQLSAYAGLLMDLSIYHKDFTISVTIPTSIATSSTTRASTPATSHTPSVYTISTSATSSLQMPQPPQSTTSQPNITPQVALTLAAIAAVALIVIILFSRRKEEPKVTKTEKIDTDTTRLPTKAAEGKKFCIECGNELSPNLSFCDSCGTKVLKQRICRI